MEPQAVILAKLVLGYLKSEKCKIAYRDFVRTSQHLQQLDISNSKYIATRFQGNTLEDIFDQYSDILQIIQGRLEATNYYNEVRPKDSLADQLLYLLNKVPSSRCTTPGDSTPLGSHIGDSPSRIDHSDLDTTRVDALPGNIPTPKHYSPKKRSFNRYGKTAIVTSSPLESENRSSEIINTELLAENLLDNKEFHEKIAQTINKVVERQFDTTVKEVIQETEQDPIFDKILDELIGTSNNLIEATKRSDSSNAIHSTNSLPEDSKKEKRNDLPDVSCSKSHKSVNDKSENQSVGSTITSTKLHQTPSKNTEVVGYDNNMVLATQCSLLTAPLYVNTVPGLLLPPITTTINPSKSFFIINKPQPPVVSSTVLTEQDIMKMPIILKDDQILDKSKEDPKSISTDAKLPTEPTEELKDFFKNYTPEDSVENKKKTGLKRVLYPRTSRKSPNPVKKLPTNSKNDKCSEGEEIIEISSSERKERTPAEQIKKATPKSGSHVRNLDFSTPTKINVPSRITETQNDTQVGNSDKTKAVKTLFAQNDPRAWDADLRTCILNDIKSPKKGASTAKKTRKRAKRGKQANVTTEEGRMLEAAIKTPIKNNSDIQPSEVPTTAIVDQNSVDKVDDAIKTDSQVKTILSPSKLNASKQNIVETLIQEDKSKLVTPDLFKETNTNQPIKANRNINTLLETPFKYIPRTPGIFSPIVGHPAESTPFTKLLEANGMDINSVETPSVPITPGFPPITPNIESGSHYSNRPTDYSTGSSYYQPSDNEQNKYVEAQLREIEKSSASNKIVIKEVVTINDHLQIFNKNIIGKKNLSLIKHHHNNSDNSISSNNSTEDEKETETTSEWCDKESSDTIIFKKKAVEAPKCTYSLRTRSKSRKGSSPQKKVVNTNITKSTKATKKSSGRVKKLSDTSLSDEQNSENNKSITSPTSVDIPVKLESIPVGVTTTQFSVLKDLEKKRLRTVNSFKSDPVTKTKKQQSGKFKIKPMAKVFTTKTAKKSESPKKRKKAKELETLLKDLITSDDSDLNTSVVEEENIKKNLKTDIVDTTASDVEAQTLIEGLKERGIHLMQNKSPKKRLNNVETKEHIDIVNTSDLHMETEDREEFDKTTFKDEDVINIIHDNTVKTTKVSVIPDDLDKIEYVGRLYLESISKEIDIHLKLTNFFSLIDLKPDKQPVSPNKEKLKNPKSKITNSNKEKQENNQSECQQSIEKNKITEIQKADEQKISNQVKIDEKHQITETACDSFQNIDQKQNFEACKVPSQSPIHGDEDLMNFALLGKDKTEESSSPKSARKRKLSEDSESENSRTKMLKSLDVDSFLNKIHQTNFKLPKKS